MKVFLTSLPGILTLAGIVALFFIKFVPALSKRADYKVVIQILVTVVILAAGLYIILSKNYPEDTTKWAFGVVGVAIGYWLPK